MGNLLKGKTFTLRGEKRYALQMWQFVSVSMLAVTMFIVYRDGQIMKGLATQQYSVYEVDRAGSVTVHPAEEYQVGPLQVEIEGRAADTVRWIMQAGSSDVETACIEATRNMTEDMVRDFDAKYGDAWVEKIKKLNIYRKLEDFQVRPLKPEDLPAEDRNKVKITKYDVVVYGKAQIYRRGTGDWLDEVNFAIHVTLQPQEARTPDNMSALLVDLMSDLDPKQIMGIKDNPADANGDANSAVKHNDKPAAKPETSNTDSKTAKPAAGTEK